jgi:glyoxylase-like metal-dependent hydrolase (beta-lactamase superfamily II)
MHQIAPNLYTFSGLVMGRVYAITDEATVTLIDTGLDLAAPRVLAQLQAAGYAPTQITRILITHAHRDHVASLPILRATTGAKVFCSTIEKPVLEGDTPPVMPNEAERSALDKLIYSRPQTIQPVPVDVALNVGDVLESAIGPLQVVSAAGHTPGQIAFWQAGRKTLFCGDAMMNLWRLSLPFSAFTQSMIQARATVKQLAALAPEILCCGHGQPILRDTATKLQKFADKV